MEAKWNIVKKNDNNTFICSEFILRLQIDKMPKITIPKNKPSKKLQSLLVIDTQCYTNHS